MRTALLSFIALCATPAVAAISDSVESGFRRVLISVCVFGGITLVSTFVGGLLAKRVAPASREKRRALLALFQFIGIAAGGFAAIALLRS